MINTHASTLDENPACDAVDTAAVEGCQALAFWLSRRHCVIVWRDGPRRLRPVERGKRIRDLRPGDAVYLQDDEPHEVVSVAVYR